jgi:hypothetical protein
LHLEPQIGRCVRVRLRAGHCAGNCASYIASHIAGHIAGRIDAGEFRGEQPGRFYLS